MSDRTSRGRRAAIAAVALLLPIVATATAVPAQAADSAPAYSAGEFWQDYGDAVDIVNGYWTAHWSDALPGTYSAPSMVAVPGRRLGIYDGTVDGLSCGTPSAGGFPLQAGNAYYCGAGDFVAFDVGFLWQNANTEGDVFPFLVVAHEWGHAVQARLDPALQSPEAELQADCFAGAALQGAADDGSFVLQDTDTTEFVSSLVAIADRAPWTKPGDHGSAEERVGAFDRGAAQGPAGCLGW